MGAWKEAGSVFAGAQRVPGMLWRSTREMGGAVAVWVRAERKGSKKGDEGAAGGEFTARLLALVAPGYVMVYAADGRPWLWLVYGGSWFVGCCALAARRGDLPDEGDTAGDDAGDDEEAAPSRAGRLRLRLLARRTEERPADESAEEDEEGPEEAEEDTTPVNDHEKSPGERREDEPAEDSQEQERARKIALIWEQVEYLVGAAVQEGRKGARVVDILTAFQESGSLPEWDEKRFRELLRSIKIPVREQMYFKVDGVKKNQPGVHVEDLSRELGRAPRVPAHLVPDLTPVQDRPPALSLVKNGAPAGGHEEAG